MTNPVVDPTTPAPDMFANYSALLDYYSDITLRMVNQSTKVIVDAADNFKIGTQTVDDYYTTVSQLADIALSGWTEIAATALAGPGFTLLPVASASDWLAVPGNQANVHHVQLPGPLTRGFSKDAIAPARFGLEAQQADSTLVQCPTGLLPAGTTQFRLLLNRAGIHSGCYTGTVLVTETAGGGAPAAPTSVDVEIEL